MLDGLPTPRRPSPQNDRGTTNERARARCGTGACERARGDARAESTVFVDRPKPQPVPRNSSFLQPSHVEGFPPRLPYFFRERHLPAFRAGILV